MIKKRSGRQFQIVKQTYSGKIKKIIVPTMDIIENGSVVLDLFI